MNFFHYGVEGDLVKSWGNFPSCNMHSYPILKTHIFIFASFPSLLFRFGHVNRRPMDALIKKYDYEINAQSKRGKGRPKKIWKETI